MELDKQFTYFEKTPFYMFDPKVPELIEKIIPWAKIIFLLRDPVSRAYSQFKFMCAGCDVLKFNECIELELDVLDEAEMLVDDLLELDTPEIESRWKNYWNEGKKMVKKNRLCDRFIGRGLYFIQLKRWFMLRSSSEKKALLVLKSESLRPDEATNKVNMTLITKFLGIEQYEVISNKPIHATKDMEPMTEETRQKLMKLFDPFNKKLSSILGDQWNDPWHYDLSF